MAHAVEASIGDIPHLDLVEIADGVPHGARSIEIGGRQFWLEQTRVLPQPQVAVVDAETGEVQGYFYPRRDGHLSHEPCERGNQHQEEIVGEIAIKFPFGI